MFASHVDSRALVDRTWPDLRDAVRTVLDGIGLDELEAEELTVVPGVDELLALTEIARFAGAGTWDVVVVDCGPTAETLRLLALPEAVHRYLRGGARGGLRAAFTGLTGRPPVISTPMSTVMSASASLNRLVEHLAALRDLLTDRHGTTVRLVLTPERIVVAETRRTLAALALRGIHVDCLVANRLLPRARLWHGPAANWLRTRRAEQDAVLAELAASSPLRIRTIEHLASEPVGTAALTGIADELYAGLDPLDGVTAPHVPLLRVEADGAGYRLAIAMPIPDATELDLARVGDELAITVGAERRLVSLPVVLRRYTVAGADADANGITVRFDPGLA